MAIGNVGTYATLQPVQGDPIGKALDTVEQNAFKYREEEAARVKLAKEGEEKRVTGISDLSGDYNISVTGNSVIDDPFYEYAMSARENEARLQQQMIQNPNMSPIEVANIKKQISKQQQSMAYLKQFPKLVTEKVAGLIEGIKDGKYYETDIDRFQKEIKSLETGKYNLYVDGNGNPKIRILEEDEKGNYTKVLKETGLGDYLNNVNPRKNFEYTKSIGEFSEKIKPTVIATQKGANITKKEQLTPQIVNSVNSYTEYLLSDPDTSSIMREENPGLNDAQLAQKITDDIYARILTKNEQSLDTGFLNYSRGVQKDQEEQATFGVVETPPEFASSGANPAKGYKTVSVTGSKPLTRVGDYNLATLDAYTVEKMPNGQRSVTAVVNYPIIKTSTLSAEEQLTFKKANSGQKLNEDEQLTLDKITKGAEYGKKVVRLTEKEAYKFAKQMGLPDVNAMKDAAYVGGEDAQKQSTTIQFDSKGNIIE